jgi:hypothetical protein
MKHRRTAEIVRNGKRWSVHTAHYWDGYERPSHTYGSASTLAAAVFDCAFTRQRDTRLTHLTVGGRTIGRAEAAKLIASRPLLGYMADAAIAALAMPEA